MSKIICDICGTSYPETASACPICGCSRDASATLLGEENLNFSVDSAPVAGKKQREIFDFDEVNGDKQQVIPEEEDDEEYEDEDEGGRSHNTVAVIVLTALIALLLVAAGFLFIKFYLPSMGGSEATETTLSAEETMETQAPVETQDPLAVPCESLVLASGGAELTSAGQYFLLNVTVMPENTTDTLTFHSADENIATVTADGKITAVSEGETTIYITCGSVQLDAPVTCNFAPVQAQETEPPTEASEASEATEPAETQAPTQEPTTSPTLQDVELKLKKKDISIGVGYSYDLLLDCKLEQNAVEWSSEHPYICKVDDKGTITTLKQGTTAIHAKYGDQDVSCIVRCG